MQNINRFILTLIENNYKFTTRLFANPKQHKAMENLINELKNNLLQNQTRRYFLQNTALGLGSLGLGSILGSCADNNKNQNLANSQQSQLNLPQFNPKAKQVIFIHMAGAPSQLELYDYKPQLTKFDGKDCPQEFLEGKKFAFIKGTPKLLGQKAKFAQYGIRFIIG